MSYNIYVKHKTLLSLPLELADGFETFVRYVRSSSINPFWVKEAGSTPFLINLKNKTYKLHDRLGRLRKKSKGFLVAGGKLLSYLKDIYNKWDFAVFNLH